MTFKSNSFEEKSFHGKQRLEESRCFSKMKRLFRRESVTVFSFE